jgi:hypothetical protein
LFQGQTHRQTEREREREREKERERERERDDEELNPIPRRLPRCGDKILNHAILMKKPY